MNYDAVKKLAGGLALTLSLAVLPAVLPAAAQSDAPRLDTTPLQETKDDRNNLGWLGLIGLIGLANLFRKPKTHSAYRETREPEVTPRSDYRE